MKELWKIFPGDWRYEYAVSNTGRVKKLSHLDINGYVVQEKELDRKRGHEYPKVELKGLDGIRHKVPVAEMVLETFDKGKKPGPTYRAGFKDEDMNNCCLNNLYWKDIKKIKNIGPNSGQYTCKYKNILAYSDDKLIRCYDTISDLSDELSEHLKTKRSSIQSKCGSNFKRGKKNYHGLRLELVDINTYNKAKKELKKVEYSLNLSDYLLLSTPRKTKKVTKKVIKKVKKAPPKPIPKVKPVKDKEPIIEDKPNSISVSKDEFMMKLMEAMDKRR